MGKRLTPPPPIRIDGDVAYIPLSKGYTAVIDAEDVHLVSNYKWCALEALKSDGSIRTVYARVTLNLPGRRSSGLQLHRLIMGVDKGTLVDHKDGNGLMNRKSNLRVCSSSENSRNARLASGTQSGFKGVKRHSQMNKWVAHITIDGKYKHLGLFDSKEDAASVYDEAAERHYGSFAKTNKSLGLLEGAV